MDLKSYLEEGFKSDKSRRAFFAAKRGKFASLRDAATKATAHARKGQADKVPRAEIYARHDAAREAHAKVVRHLDRLPAAEKAKLKRQRTTHDQGWRHHDAVKRHFYNASLSPEERKSNKELSQWWKNNNHKFSH